MGLVIGRCFGRKTMSCVVEIEVVISWGLGVIGISNLSWNNIGPYFGCFLGSHLGYWLVE